MAKSDRKFLEEAYIGSMAEVRLGKLAQDKASSSEVKDFARRMVDDHSEEIAKLSKIAEEDGVPLPSQLDSRHQKTYDRLAKLSGAEFDRAYMKEMTSDHKKDVSEYQRAAKSAKDDQLQEHAKDAVATLEEHEKMAESTRDDLRKESTVSMNTGSSQARSGSQAPSRSQMPSQSHSRTSSSQAQNR
jgi:putative membrane protein